MNTILTVDPDTERLQFHFGTTENTGQVLNSISKEQAISLMFGIAEKYGIRFGDPKCPCKDATPQTFDRYMNRWRIQETHS